MSDIRYINLQVTPQKWENQYFGDFEAPISLYPAPSRPTPTPTPTPSVTPTITPSVSTTPAATKTPTPTPTASPGPPTPTPTPSITPSITPSNTPTYTPTQTPTASITPTPTPSPLPQFYILAENTDELLTESGLNLITQDGESTADIDMTNFTQGTHVDVVNNSTTSTVIDYYVTQDNDTTTTSFASGVDLTFNWANQTNTDSLYRIDVYNNDGGSLGELLDSSSETISGSYNYTGKTAVVVKVEKTTTNGNVLNITPTGSIPGTGFTYSGRVYTINPESTQWGINGSTPWGSRQYHTGIISGAGYTYKFIFIRTALTTWSRYLYRFDTQTFALNGTITASPISYGDSDLTTLVNNL